MNIHSLYLWAWGGSALVAAFVGLEATGCNILKSLGLNGVRKELQYLAGAVGLMSLCAYCLKNNAVLVQIHAIGSCVNTTVWLISAITATSVGLAALKINILESLKLNAHRKTLQYIVGAAGAYSLYLYFGK
ncbi:MAG: hypothetical protein ACJAZS_000710 [Alteromonas naphthalenivorans]|jgi:hypothetical protein